MKTIQDWEMELVNSWSGCSSLDCDCSATSDTREVLEAVRREAFQAGMIQAAEICREESRQPIEHGAFSAHHKAAYETAVLKITNAARILPKHI